MPEKSTTARKSRASKSARHAPAAPPPLSEFTTTMTRDDFAPLGFGMGARVTFHNHPLIEYAPGDLVAFTPPGALVTNGVSVAVLIGFQTTGVIVLSEFNDRDDTEEYQAHEITLHGRAERKTEGGGSDA